MCIRDSVYSTTIIIIIKFKGISLHSATYPKTIMMFFANLFISRFFVLPQGLFYTPVVLPFLRYCPIFDIILRYFDFSTNPLKSPIKMVFLPDHTALPDTRNNSASSCKDYSQSHACLLYTSRCV